MIKVYKDNSVYVGEMVSEQRSGNGTLYILDDFFAGYKISGDWQDDKLNGWSKTTTKTYTEAGKFDDGVQTGSFFRIYNDGRHSAISYSKGKNVSEDVYAYCRKRKEEFGCVKLSEDEYYLGDIYNNEPFGYGMIYKIDDKKNITGQIFCEIYGSNISKRVELDKKFQEVEIVY